MGIHCGSVLRSNQLDKESRKEYLEQIGNKILLPKKAILNVLIIFLLKRKKNMRIVKIDI